MDKTNCAQNFTSFLQGDKVHCQLHLKLCAATENRQKTTAWFLSGSNPQKWLADIVCWNLPQERLRLYILPASSSSQTSGGALFVFENPLEIPRNPRIISFYCLHGSFYIPEGACLYPEIALEEARKLSDHCIFIFHPGIGLVRFQKESALGLEQLIAAPPSARANWGVARPGAFLSNHILSVRGEIPSERTELYGSAVEEIATLPMEELNPMQKEPTDSALFIGIRKLNHFISRSLAQLAGTPGKGRAGAEQKRQQGYQTANQGSFGNWVAQRLQASNKALEELRYREIFRLLHLLEEDAEKGLRYAIPLGDSTYRGLARRSTSALLKEHNTEFSLQGISRKGMTLWEVPSFIRDQLLLKYRALAEREAQLGRYRRAAYIYAELLRDFEAAVAVLKEGSHYREAAAIYKDYLSNPLEAARCLAEGRLFSEAIALFEKLEEHLQCGKLYRILGHRIQAETAFRKAVDQRVQADDLAGAAEILETYLHAQQDALMILEAAWPRSRQAARCLEKQFKILGVIGDHSRAATLLSRLRKEQTPPVKIKPLATVLTGIASAYPDHGVRKTAADLAFVKIGARLPDADLAETQALVEMLSRLAPQDILLNRDAYRFLNEKRTMSKRSQFATTFSEDGTVSLLHQFNLPEGIYWKTAETSVEALFAAGWGYSENADSSSTLHFTRSSWDGESHQTLSWAVQPQKTALELKIPPHPRQAILLRLDKKQALEPKTLAATDALPILRVVGGIPGISQNTIATAFAQDGSLWVVRHVQNELQLNSYDPSGRLVADIDLLRLPIQSTRIMHSHSKETSPPSLSQLMESAQVPSKILLATLKGELFLGFGQMLLRVNRSRQLSVSYWEQEIRQLSTAPDWVAPRLALSFAKGASILWTDLPAAKTPPKLIAHEMNNPLAACLRDGSLILLTTKEGRIYHLNQAGAECTVRFPWKWKQPQSVFAAHSLDTFAVLSAEGEVRLFRYQRLS